MLPLQTTHNFYTQFQFSKFFYFTFNKPGVFFSTITPHLKKKNPHRHTSSQAKSVCNIAIFTKYNVDRFSTVIRIVRKYRQVLCDISLFTFPCLTSPKTYGPTWLVPSKKDKPWAHIWYKHRIWIFWIEKEWKSWTINLIRSHISIIVIWKFHWMKDFVNSGRITNSERLVNHISFSYSISAI